MSLTAFATATGPAFVDLEQIDSISAPFQAIGHDSRVITTRGGAKVYVLNTNDNYHKLAHLLPEDTKVVLAQTPGLKAEPPRVVALKAARGRLKAKGEK